ncbi:hypothetical protein SDC9_172428 [bioreactor metagenome]|uniref:Uncharacterized protein n=1 Tax=bioreactor metagenome TaxID=1076179 RepID=A0A645GDM4_9ZZZZ
MTSPFCTIEIRLPLNRPNKVSIIPKRVMYKAGNEPAISMVNKDKPSKNRYRRMEPKSMMKLVSNAWLKNG